jgi:hypothetical protein
MRRRAFMRTVRIIALRTVSRTTQEECAMAYRANSLSAATGWLTVIYRTVPHSHVVVAHAAERGVWSGEPRAGRGMGILVAACLGLTFLAAGCTGQEEAGQSPPTSGAQGQESSIVGTYEAELSPSGDLLREPNPPGTWRLTISEESALLRTPQGQEFPPGDPVTLEDDTITFSPDPECPTQEGEATEGVYEYQLEEATLAFVEVEDSCRDRAFVLTSETWSRVG